MRTTCCLLVIIGTFMCGTAQGAEWFFHSFGLPQHFITERLSTVDNWKETATSYCSGRLLVGAENINEKLKAHHVTAATIEQGLVAVRMDDIGGQDADLYLYCSADLSRFFIVGHFNNAPQLQANVYRYVLEEFHLESSKP